jgi:tetratricopeptide (TPR) repeat protein
MRTKISAFCDKVMEAGWLLALVIVPLFFDVYSSRVFEPDKIGLLRTIATFMVVAWLAKFAEEVLAGEGGRQVTGEPRALDRFLRTPLVVPTLLMAVVYILATITSVVPRISLWGSYQRLQGTYTTFSYMVVFLVILQTLRRPEQVRRLLTTMILTSLPIALYGLLQHYHLDPLPWGGDVVSRVASNMGNPIFVGAYLIMVVPLTLARMIQLGTTALGDLRREIKLGLGLVFGALLVVQTWAWSTIGFERGLLAALLIMVMLALAAIYFRRPVVRFVLLGGYGFTLSAQLVCIYFTASRGPWLGMIGSLFFFGVLYAFARRWRKTTVALVSGAILLFFVLILMNVPNTPLAQIRNLPYVGRLGSVFETEGGTGKVRVLIWEGVVNMLQANPLRTLIGYGPESMYVAYNPYYPPDLAHYEARNASPDRSHNETFDSLVITGVLGFIVYMFLFLSLFYYGLSALGLIHDRIRKILYLVCSIAGSLLGVIVVSMVEGSLRFAGVGLPLGLMVGLSAYVAVSAIIDLLGKRQEEPSASRLGGWDLLLVVALVSAVVGHFIEIHFGIAIAATRTYFWSYAALLVIVGQGWIKAPEMAEKAERAEHSATTAPAVKGGATRQVVHRKGGRRGATAAAFTQAVVRVESVRAQLLAMAVVVGLIMSTMFWDYTTNPLGSSSPLSVLATSLTTFAAKRAPDQITLGMLWLFLATFVIAALISVSEVADSDGETRDVTWWLSSLGILTLVAAGIGGLFALIHAARLDPRSDVSNLIYEYYIWVFILWIALTTVLHLSLPRPTSVVRGLMFLGYPILILLCALFIDGANSRIVKADVLYKQGLRYDQEGNWDNAIYFYQKAIDVTPNEDFYYLFRGRALMERAKQESDAKTRDVYFGRAQTSLEQAHRLNPLNTDHLANMGRLQRTWAEVDTDTKSRQAKLERALGYYAEATQSSPHNAQLFNEWGLVYYMLGNPDQAKVKYDQSLALDQQFAQTYHLMGDIYLANKAWDQAIPFYQKAVVVDPGLMQSWSALGYCYSQLGDYNQAIIANMKVIDLYPKDYSTLKNLSILYNEAQSMTQALDFGERALAVAPDQEKASLQSFVQQLRTQLGKDK